jgi:hypothetical protein
LSFYRELIALRKRWPCLSNCRKDLTTVRIDGAMLRMERSDPSGTRALLVCNFAPTSAMFDEQRQPALQTTPAERGVIAGYSAVLYVGREVSE